MYLQMKNQLPTVAHICKFCFVNPLTSFRYIRTGFRLRRQECRSLKSAPIICICTYVHQITHRAIRNACWRWRGGRNLMLLIDHQLARRSHKIRQQCKSLLDVMGLIVLNCSSFACPPVVGVGMVVCTCTGYIQTYLLFQFFQF